MARYRYTTQACLLGSMRAAVIDKTAPESMATAFVASVPSIIGYSYGELDVLLYLFCQCKVYMTYSWLKEV